MSGKDKATSGDRRGLGERKRESPGFIIIRLSIGRDNDSDDLLELTRSLGLNLLHKFLTDYPRMRPTQLIRGARRKRVREREDKSLKTDFPYVNSLLMYWRLDVRAYPNPEELREQLADMDEVEIAYHATQVTNASPDFCVNLVPKQGYLDAAPKGIDAYWAWARYRGKGQRVKIIDLESGWIHGHVDLPNFNVHFGENSVNYGHTEYADHGAQVLGVIGGLEDGCGITGIAPKLASLDVVSHFLTLDTETGAPLTGEDRFYHCTQAIEAATENLNAGDILVVEVQRYSNEHNADFPTEIDAADADAIRLATGEKIIVIEAAANGGVDLAKWKNALGKHTLDANCPTEFFQSGAIVVGAAKSLESGCPLGHERSAWSNYGKRVDCYAWGDSIVTTGKGDIAGSSGSTDSYCDSFGHTSGATAIIAGAAAVVQSWYRAFLFCPLSPTQMRRVLKNPNTGTPQSGLAGDPIGVMPDLSRIMTFRTRWREIMRCVLERIISVGRSWRSIGMS